MGVAKQAIATQVATPAQLLWDVPCGWSLAQAATVPVAYCTAYYALVMRGRMRRGQRVLIHSGSGAVGLAAIAVCLHRGCEVLVPQARCMVTGDRRTCSVWLHWWQQACPARAVVRM